LTKALKGSRDELKLISQIVDLALEKKAFDIISLDLRELSSVSDYYLICSADSEPQVKAISDNIKNNTIIKPFHLEGYEQFRWVLLDYGEIMVHIFRTKDREYYKLEKLWADAELLKYSDEITKKKSL
tara:strand:- start:4462 stop:4845 length:384 start_codon:yes stop_codon:yes gene_type:complete